MKPLPPPSLPGCVLDTLDPLEMSEFPGVTSPGAGTEQALRVCALVGGLQRCSTRGWGQAPSGLFFPKQQLHPSLKGTASVTIVTRQQVVRASSQGTPPHSYCFSKQDNEVGHPECFSVYACFVFYFIILLLRQGLHSISQG